MELCLHQRFSIRFETVKQSEYGSLLWLSCSKSIYLTSVIVAERRSGRAAGELRRLAMLESTVSGIAIAQRRPVPQAVAAVG